MGKKNNKQQKGGKKPNVFQVASKQFKPKSKTKPVKTSLKHINSLKKEKVENLNEMFSQVQRDVKSISKNVAQEPTKQAPVVRKPPKEAVNVDNAADLFSQL